MRKDKLLIGSPLDDCYRNRGVTIKKYALQRIGMTIVFCLLSSTVHAECTPAPDCASIGYTETFCDTTYLKCPFDTSKLYCLPCDSSYKYDCSGDNMTGGTGTACGGKYVSCECGSGMIFENGNCVCDTSCTVGAIYYSDKTCSSCVDRSRFLNCLASA